MRPQKKPIRALRSFSCDGATWKKERNISHNCTKTSLEAKKVYLRAFRTENLNAKE